MHEFAEQLSEYPTKYKLLTEAYLASSCYSRVINILINLPDGERHTTLQLWVCCRAVVVIVVLVTSLDR